MSSHIREGLPSDIRTELIAARHERGWTQAELGKRVGLPQMHISGIERGKIVPRYDTLLELVRVLGRDLVLIPRELTPVVQAMALGRTDRPLYAIEPGDVAAQVLFWLMVPEPIEGTPAAPLVLIAPLVYRAICGVVGAFCAIVYLTKRSKP